jgi:DNA primase
MSELREFVERVREQTSIAGVLAAHGVSVRQEAGRRLRCRCPFHQDQNPSLVVFPADERGPERWRCFGCGQGGDVFSLLLLLGGHKRRWDAIVARARELGLEPPRPDGAAPVRGPHPAELGMEAALRAYQSRLTGEVVEWLRRRGFPERYVREQGIGYAPPGEDRVLSRLLGPDELDGARRARLVGADSLDYFGRHGGGWVVFPNRLGDRVVDLQGRAHPEADGKPKWLTRPGDVRRLWNEGVLRRRPNRVLVCEGIMDGLTAVLAGFDAVAVYGQSAFRPEWASRFDRVREVVVAYDRDAVLRAVAVAKLFGPRGRVLVLPRELGLHGDLNDLLVRCGGNVDAFRTRLADLVHRAALPLEVQIALIDPQPLVTLRDRIRPVLRDIAAWPDPIVSDHLLKLLAERVGTTLDALRRVMREMRGEKGHEP